jgi:hypothetical protein
VGSDTAIGPEFLGYGIVSEMRTVTLPADLCLQVEKKFSGRFGSLDQLLEFVLRDLLQDDALLADEAERRMVEQRLRDLGYL